MTPPVRHPPPPVGSPARHPRRGVGRRTRRSPRRLPAARPRTARGRAALRSLQRLRHRDPLRRVAAGDLGCGPPVGALPPGARPLGLGLVGISAAATAIRGVDTLGVIQFPAVGLWLVAGLLMAIAVARARVLPILIGLGFAAALPASMALGNSGPLALALLWIALAAALARRMAVARAGRLVNSRSDRYAHLPILPACRAAHPELHRTAGQHAAPPGPGPPDDRGTQEESP